jgi:hypothetical protein
MRLIAVIGQLGQKQLNQYIAYWLGFFNAMIYLEGAQSSIWINAGTKEQYLKRLASGSDMF